MESMQVPREITSHLHSMFSHQVIRKSYGERNLDSLFAKWGTVKIVEDTY